MTGLSSGVTAVAGGFHHTCALTTAGGVKCWGGGAAGVLGNGTPGGSSTPVNVTGLTSGVTAIAAGAVQSCAVIVTGGAKCWGNNRYGLLGDGTDTIPLTPVDVVGLPPGVTAISTGFNQTCALTSSGTLACWGWNPAGNIDGTSSRRTTPVDVVGLSTGAGSVSAGIFHSCGLTVIGSVKCWGQSGLLGDGTAAGSSIPVEVSGLTSGVTAISAGSYQTCAVTSGGGVKCWVFAYAQGGGTLSADPTPVDVVGLSSGVTSVSVGYGHACAVTSAGGVECWGGNDAGALGDGTTTNSLAPVAVFGLSTGVAAISAGSAHSCALMSSGGVKCWGSNTLGQLGDGTTTDALTPVDVVGLPPGITELSTGGDQTCALTTAGEVWCWGFRLLGNGTSGGSSTPVAVSGLTSGVTAISVGGQHACAVTGPGGVKCWGTNWAGQLGDGTTTERVTPVDVSGLTSGVGSVSVGALHSCAVTLTGAAKCWGEDVYRALGDGRVLEPHFATGVFYGPPVSTANFANDTVAANETVSTSTPPSASDPLQTSVTTPSAGVVHISETETSVTPPVGFALAGFQIAIDAPPTTSAEPLRFEFRVDQTTLADLGVSAASLAVFRNGTLVPDCTTPTDVRGEP